MKALRIGFMSVLILVSGVALSMGNMKNREDCYDRCTVGTTCVAGTVSIGVTVAGELSGLGSLTGVAGACAATSATIYLGNCRSYCRSMFP